MTMVIILDIAFPARSWAPITEPFYDLGPAELGLWCTWAADPPQFPTPSGRRANRPLITQQALDTLTRDHHNAQCFQHIVLYRFVARLLSIFHELFRG
ncbi:hypothetical protein HX878_20640 [Pseudomonas veronii]|uniref:hypothetical protein n=1 Tax=Pseudomonas veronii TaxID=76761 RepID=UPI0015A12DDB|nr:hypothetical protein [Pseudomonas veronii]NWD57142.1 hypothetical protein [Pseudomonas veronii]